MEAWAKTCGPYPGGLFVARALVNTLAHFAWMLGLNFLPTTGFSIKPLEVKLLAGEQKATENTCSREALNASRLAA